MFTNTFAQWMSEVRDSALQRALRFTLGALVDRSSSFAMTTSALVIKTGGSTLAKTGSAVTYMIVDGKFVDIAGSTDMPALTGITITANKYNVVCFFIDAAGTVSVALGTEATAVADVRWPNFPEKKALIGALRVTHSSTFTGGTTPLDTATTVYIPPVGPFDPNAKLG